MLEHDVNTLAEALCVDARALLGRSRSSDLATARAICYRLLIEHGHSGPVIAAHFGRDHSTVYQMRDRIVERAATSARIREMTSRGRQALLAGLSRQCKACGRVLPGADYYATNRSRCKACVIAANSARNKTYRQRKREGADHADPVSQA